jgi:hypothetical protein
MNQTKDINDWLPLIDNVARFVSSDFPDVEFEDVRSDLVVFVLTKHQLYDPEQPGANTALNRQARTYAWDQRKQHLTLSVQYSYRPSDVRKILETLGNYRTWPNAQTPEDAKSRKGNDSIEMSADISRAFSKLRGPYQDVIRQRYFLKQTFENGSSESKRLSRAIGALCDILNFYDVEAYDRRQVLSNSQAQHRISSSYDG